MLYYQNDLYHRLNTNFHKAAGINMAQLREKNQDVVEKLYDKSLNFCASCGLRITDDQYPAH